LDGRKVDRIDVESELSPFEKDKIVVESNLNDGSCHFLAVEINRNFQRIKIFASHCGEPREIGGPHSK
jgi:hypothetical protein